MSTTYYPTILTPSVFVSISNFAVSFPLKGDAKVQTIFGTCKRFTENLYIFNIASLYSIYIKDLDTYFRHKLTKMCNILVQITDTGCKYSLYIRTLYKSV